MKRRILINSKHPESGESSTRTFNILHFEFNKATNELDLQLDANDGHFEMICDGYSKPALQLVGDVIIKGGKEVQVNTEIREEVESFVIALGQNMFTASTLDAKTGLEIVYKSL